MTHIYNPAHASVGLCGVEDYINRPGTYLLDYDRARVLYQQHRLGSIVDCVRCTEALRAREQSRMVRA